jgi:glycosyltransferase involved in cell wall biosynthesis
MLSFITPAYNTAVFLSATLESTLSQQLDVPFEVVVVDDASSDETPAVIARYRERFPDLLRSFRNEENRGGGATRNRAIGEARGELLYIVDSDNILPGGCAQTVLECLRETGLESASVARQRYFVEDTARLEHAWLLTQEGGRSSLRELFKSTAVPASHGNYLFTRSLFEAAGAYEEDRGAMESWTFGLKHILAGFDVAIAPGTYYFHRIGRGDSEWSVDEKRGVNDANAIAVLREHLNELPPDLLEKISLLDPSDRFFKYVDAGLFQPEISLDEFKAERERMRAAQPVPPGRLRRALRRIRQVA